MLAPFKKGTTGLPKVAKTADEPKMAQNHKCPSHSVPYKPHGVGTQKDPCKIILLFMKQVFGPDPPKTPHFKPTFLRRHERGVGGGVKNVEKWHTFWFLSILSRKSEPLGVGDANRPKKAQNGESCDVFPYVWARLALSNNPCEVIGKNCPEKPLQYRPCDSCRRQLSPIQGRKSN